jgi:hypothetical protein
MLLCMERTFEYRMRPNTTQEAALFTVLKASRRLYLQVCADHQTFLWVVSPMYLHG